MKSLLLITDSFPPAFAPRMGYLCKYLARNSEWAVTCVHAKINKRRTDHAATFSHLVGFVNKEYEYLWEDGIHVISLRQGFERLFRGGFPIGEFVAFLLGKVWYKIFKYGFNLEAKSIVRRALTEGTYDLILGSSGGARVYELAEYARRLSGLPLIQDFRDVSEERAQVVKGIRAAALLACRNRCVERANSVVVTTKSHQCLLGKNNSKTILIHNGYDPDIFLRGVPEPGPEFVIVYVGSFYRDVSPIDIMIRGLCEFVSQPFVRGKAKAVFYSPESAYEKDIVPYVPESLRSAVVNAPSVPQDRLCQVFRRASVLLTLSHIKLDTCGHITTKLFEYLASGRPILEVSSGLIGEEEEILEDCRGGVIASSSNEIVRFLNGKFDEWMQTGVVANCGDEEKVSRFSRARECAEYLKLMEQVSEK